MTRENIQPITKAIFFLALVINAALWFQIIQNKPALTSEITFLDVGQGDSSFITLPGDVRIIIDAGPGRKTLQSLQAILPVGKKYIDIGIITHPQLDHFGGFLPLLDRYSFGVIITNGRDAESESLNEWQELLEKAKENNTPIVVLGRGDRISYASNTIQIINPGNEFRQSGELNDTGLVTKITTNEFKALLVADIGFNVEEWLIKNEDIASDILKIGHHGSKYSSSDEFLRAVNPLLAVISSGAGNRYGHPHPDTLLRLASSVPAIIRTDERGNVTVRASEKGINVFSER